MINMFLKFFSRLRHNRKTLGKAWCYAFRCQQNIFDQQGFIPAMFAFRRYVLTTEYKRDLLTLVFPSSAAYVNLASFNSYAL